ncbi:MAG TPA: MFS transporter [Halococcus sp.]|nr:MFS transporter [Halococcus sp.]
MSGAETTYSTRTVVLSLVAGVFFGGVVGGVAFPTLPRLGALLGFSALVVGIILSVNRLTRMVLNAPAGTVLDRFGTRRPMLAGFVFEGLAPVGYVLGLTGAWTGGIASVLPVTATTVSAATFVLARVLWGVGSAFVIVGAFSTVTQVTTTENRGKWTGYMRAGQTLGFPAGLVAGGLAANLLGFRAAFVLAGVADVIALVVAYLYLPDIRADVDEPTRLRDIPRLALADTRVFAIGTTNFVCRLLYSGILLSTVVTYVATKNISIGVLSATGVSGIVMAVSALFSGITTVVVGNAADNVTDRALVSLPSLAFFGGGFAALALVPTLAGTLAGAAAIGIGVEGTSLPLLAYLGDISPAEDVGKLGGVYNVFGDFGGTVGPLVALPFAEGFGYGIEYLLCVVFVVAAGALVAVSLLGKDSTTVNEPAVTADD